jgi:hypothetical protein
MNGTRSPKGERIDHVGETVVGVAVLCPPDGNGAKLWALHGKSVCGKAVGYCSIYFKDRQDRDWAVKTWKTMKRR